MTDREETGSDDLMSDEQRHEVEARAAADRAAVEAEEQRTAEQPADGDG